ncbi:hypothetical protein VTH06DRAFT_2131 [Thermothelomyces fergusii]
MADPVGLVSLGLEVCRGIIQYVDALKSRKQDLSTAKQHGDDLQEILDSIKTYVGGLGSDSDDTVKSIYPCLETCETEIRALNELIAELAGSDKATSVKDKAKNTMKKVQYPFDRSKLQLFEERLRSSVRAMQVALLLLNLEASRRGATELATLRSTFASITDSQETANLRILSEVTALSAPIRDVQGVLSGIVTRFERLETVAAKFQSGVEKLDAVETAFQQLLARDEEATRNLQETTPEMMMAKRLVSKPAALRQLCDTTNELSDVVCSCPRRRYLRRNDRTWWFLTVSSEMSAEQQHLPDCRYARRPGAEQTRTMAVGYTGLRRLLKTAVRVSFSMRTGAGGWSISPSFSYYPTVDTSRAPAFRMITLLLDCAESSLGLPPFFEKLTKIVLAKVFELLETGKASPRAVDSKNKSLLHHMANLISVACLQSSYTWDDEAGAFASSDTWNSHNSPLLHAAKGLVHLGVPATEYDTDGLTPLGNLVEGTTQSAFGECIDIAAEYIRFTGSENVPPALPRSQDGLPSDSVPYRLHVDNPATILSFLSDPSIAQTYECGPLSLAVLANDVQQVQHLLQRHPATLKERNLFGQTPLHLAADKPDCLRLLLSKADKELLNARDASQHSPLDMALCASATICPDADVRNPLQPWERREECEDCDCAECVVILLEADCATPVTNLDYLLSWASRRCWSHLARAMRDRRQKLRQLAFDRLAIEPARAEEMGLLDDDAVFDAYASQVVRLLRERGVHIPEALDLGVPADEPPLSVYGRFRNPQFADTFFQEGFRDTMFWVSDHILPVYRTYTKTPLSYFLWLDAHGADVLFDRTGPLDDCPGYLTGHLTFFIFGWHIGVNPGLIKTPDPRWVRWLHDAVPGHDLTDDCRCGCSAEGCTPLTCLLRGIYIGQYGFQVYDGEYSGDKVSFISRVLDTFLPILELLASSARLELAHHLECLRFLTLTALLIPHTCHCPGSRSFFCRHSAEEREELSSEQEGQVQALEKLLGELESKMAGIPGYPNCELGGLEDFYRTTWLDRVKEAQQDLDGDSLAPEEIRRAEEIGVVWHLPTTPEPERAKNPYSKDELEYWAYELGRIGQISRDTGLLTWVLGMYYEHITRARTSKFLTVPTSNGPVTGHLAPGTSCVLEYLGIPYAKPPVGELRFAAPQPIDRQRPYTAANFGFDCPQTASKPSEYPGLTPQAQRIIDYFASGTGNPQSEDCLTLNIWSKPTARAAAADKPVLVFLYGGRFTAGNTNTPFWNGKRLADAEDLVVVTVNYRTNIFGFPGAPAAGGARQKNLGLRDQRAAVEWVRDNIAAFGGDPRRIVLAGQSAGGVSADYWAFAYEHDPIVAGLILVSGTALSFPLNPPDVPARNWAAVAAAVGCANGTAAASNDDDNAAAVMACMRAVPWPDLEAAAAGVRALPSTSPLRAVPAFYPEADGEVVFADYAARARAGRLARLPVLASTAADEAGWYRLRAFAAGVEPTPDQVAAFHLESFVCPAAHQAAARRRLGAAGVPAWVYRYAADWPNTRLYAGSGAYHGADLHMVFGASEEVSGLPEEPAQRRLVRVVQRAWAAFADDPRAGLRREMGWPAWGDDADGGRGGSLVVLGEGNRASVRFVPSAWYVDACRNVTMGGE